MDQQDSSTQHLAADRAASPQHETHLLDLDDACLLMIIKNLMPLPDLFCCAQTCWRFHRLTSDKRMWLVVSPRYIPPEDTPSGRAGVVHNTLKTAVLASRPGDTIWLAPFTTHEASDIHIPHPLHILGGGFNPEDTQITAPPGADCVLSFGASCKVAMLAFSATLCPCLVHRKGLLTVERCKLTSDPKGLMHLVSPVLTLAASSRAVGLVPHRTPAAGFVKHWTDTVDLEIVKPIVPPPLAAAAAAAAAAGVARSVDLSSSQVIQHCVGGGRLVITECCLLGGSAAVRCSGTGRLRDVRVIYESRAAVFWLEVDSTDPGCGLQQQQQVVVMQYSDLEQQQQQELPDQLQQQQPFDIVRTSKAKAWQQSRMLGTTGTSTVGDCCRVQQQQQQQQEDGVGGVSGLARIQTVLGKRVNPTLLAAHIGARKQQQQQQ